MERFNHQGFWVNREKRFADPKLKGADHRFAQAAAKIFDIHLDKQGIYLNQIILRINYQILNPFLYEYYC